jgi:FlaA1/EpsC-like NDP-sugar epimerase
VRRQFNIRVLLTVLHDCAAVGAAWLATYALRFGTADMWPWLLANGPVLVMVGLVEILIFAAFGLYRGLWRYASLRDLRQLLIAVGVAAVCAPVVQSMVAPGTVLPRSTLLMHPVLLFVFMGAGRLAYLLWHDRSGLSNLRAGDPVVIIGAGVTGARLVELLRLSPRWRAVALVDDDRGKQGRVVHGVPVMGPTAEAAAIAERTGARAVVMAIPSA